jgi:hypothetical protein
MLINLQFSIDLWPDPQDHDQILLSFFHLKLFSYLFYQASRKFPSIFWLFLLALSQFDGLFIEQVYFGSFLFHSTLVGPFVQPFERL